LVNFLVILLYLFSDKSCCLFAFHPAMTAKPKSGELSDAVTTEQARQPTLRN